MSVTKFGEENPCKYYGRRRTSNDEKSSLDPLEL